MSVWCVKQTRSQPEVFPSSLQEMHQAAEPVCRWIDFIHHQNRNQFGLIMFGGSDWRILPTFKLAECWTGCLRAVSSGYLQEVNFTSRFTHNLSSCNEHGSDIVSRFSGPASVFKTRQVWPADVWLILMYSSVWDQKVEIPLMLFIFSLCHSVKLLHCF